MTMTTARSGLNPSWLVTRTLLDAIVDGQPGMTFANTLTAGPARPTTATRYACGIMLQTGKVALVPEVGTTIDVYDPVSNTIIANVAHNQMGSSTIFVSAVLLPNGTVLCIPFQATNFVIFDPVALACRPTVAHGLAATSAIPAFSGGVLGQDDIVAGVTPLVYLAPGADPRVSVYDYTSDAIAYRANIVGSTPTARPYAGPVLLPNGDIFFPQWKTSNSSARYRPSTNTVTASPNTGVSTAGAMLSADGSTLVFVADAANYVRAYDIATDTLTSESGGAAMDQSGSGGALLPDGRIAIWPGNSQNITAVDPTPIVNLQMSPLPPNVGVLRAMSADGALLGTNNGPISGYNTTGGVCLGNGSYLLLTNGAWKTTLLLWTPYTGADAVPSEAMIGRYFNRRV